MGRDPSQLCGRTHGDQIVLRVLSTLFLFADKTGLPPAEGDVSSCCGDFHSLIMSRPLSQWGIALQTL